MGTELPVGEGYRGVSSPGGTSDGGHGPQTSAGRDVGVPTHWSGAENGGTVGYRGIYCPPPEHGRGIHCDPSYHGILFGGGKEDGGAPIQAMGGTSRPGFPGDQGRAGSCGGEEGDGGGRTGVGKRGRLGEGRMMGKE